MMKKIVLLLALAMSTTHLTGCSLFSSSESETENAAVSEENKESPAATTEGGTDELDGEITPDSGTQTTAATADTAAPGTDEYPDDDYDLGSPTTVAETPSTAETESLLVDEGGGKEESPIFESSNEPQADELPAETLAEEKPTKRRKNYVEDAPPVTSAGLSPLKKMETEAFTRAGTKLNRLYVARSGDSIKEVSQKIYGEDKSAKLLKWNPSLHRSLKVGDKVYYASATNPDDNKVMLYYEENGISPTFFNLKKGQSFRKVAKELLGHERSWMEIWATNPNIESKWEVTADEQIRYWPTGTTGSPIAKTEPKPEPPAPKQEEPQAQPQQPAEEISEVSDPATEPMPADPGQTAGTEIADGTQIEEVDNNEDFSPPPAQANTGAPPPPPPAAGAPPPPPANALAGTDDGSVNGMGQDDTMMQVAMGVLVILLGLILLIMVRRNRAKAKKVKLSQTQV